MEQKKMKCICLILDYSVYPANQSFEYIILFTQIWYGDVVNTHIQLLNGNIGYRDEWMDSFYLLD